jgi:hypothetical protein
MSTYVTKVVKEGYLWICPPTRARKAPIKNWHRQWVILRTDGQDYVLEYFEDRAKLKLDETVRLRRPIEVLLVPDYGRDNVFCVKTVERVIFMSASSNSEMYKWAQVVARVLRLVAQVKSYELVYTIYNILYVTLSCVFILLCILFVW